MKRESVQWCDKHWAEVRQLQERGTHNGIAATAGLLQAWIDKRTKAGTLPRPHQTARLNRLLARDAPLCCTLGDEVRQRVIDESRNH